MPSVPLITKIDPGTFKGLLQEDDDTCTIEATVPTGMEDVCAEEARERLGVSATACTGRVFFDVAVGDVPKVLLLRSAENIHVVIHMQPAFLFTTVREDCFTALYHLAERPLWHKGVQVWQRVFGALDKEPFTVDRPLTQHHQVPNPVLDLRKLKQGSPVALNLPDDIKQLRAEHQKQLDEADERDHKNKAVEETPQETGAVCQQTSTQVAKPSGVPGIPTANSLPLHGDELLESKRTSEDNSALLKRGSQRTGELEHCNSLGPENQNCSISSIDKKLESTSLDLETDSIIADVGGGLVVSQRLCENGNGPSFRVCCYRAGTCHVFGSPEAARQLGAAINDRFNWPVRLKQHQVEVILSITDDFVYVSIGLTREPLYKRNLVSFGPTNLRATLSYALLHLARPRPGDLVMDHMCGGGSIPLEGAISFPSCFHLGGELHDRAITRALSNLQHHSAQGTSLAADLAHWDATRLPLRNSCVDVVVSDLPFGKRSGSKLDNRVLYLRALQETARVTLPSAGRAVLLTHDRNSMAKNLLLVKKYWKNTSIRTINIGGLHAAVYLLLRSSALYTPSTIKASDD